MWWHESDDEIESERMSKEEKMQEKDNVSEGGGKRERKGEQDPQSGGREREKGKRRGLERKKKERARRRGWKRKGKKSRREKGGEGEQEISLKRKRWQERKIERAMLRGRDGMKEWSWVGELYIPLHSFWSQLYIEHILYIKHFTYFIYQIRHLLKYSMLLFVKLCLSICRGCQISKNECTFTYK